MGRMGKETPINPEVPAGIDYTTPYPTTGDNGNKMAEAEEHAADIPNKAVL